MALSQRNREGRKVPGKESPRPFATGSWNIIEEQARGIKPSRGVNAEGVQVRINELKGKRTIDVCSAERPSSEKNMHAIEILSGLQSTVMARAVNRPEPGAAAH